MSQETTKKRPLWWKIIMIHQILPAFAFLFSLISGIPLNFTIYLTYGAISTILFGIASIIQKETYFLHKLIPQRITGYTAILYGIYSIVIGIMILLFVIYEDTILTLIGT